MKGGQRSVASGLGVLAGLVLVTWGLSNGQATLGRVGQEVLWFLVVFLIVIPIHELGHALAGFLVGHRIRSVVIGVGRPLLVFNLAGVAVTINLLPLGGLTMGMPRRGGWLRVRLWIFAAGGPAANLLLCYVLPPPLRPRGTSRLPGLGHRRAASVGDHCRQRELVGVAAQPDSVQDRRRAGLGRLFAVHDPVLEGRADRRGAGGGRGGPLDRGVASGRHRSGGAAGRSARGALSGACSDGELDGLGAPPSGSPPGGDRLVAPVPGPGDAPAVGRLSEEQHRLRRGGAGRSGELRRGRRLLGRGDGGPPRADAVRRHARRRAGTPRARRRGAAAAPACGGDSHARPQPGLQPRVAGQRAGDAGPPGRGPPRAGRRPTVEPGLRAARRGRGGSAGGPRRARGTAGRDRSAAGDRMGEVGRPRALEADRARPGLRLHAGAARRGVARHLHTPPRAGRHAQPRAHGPRWRSAPATCGWRPPAIRPPRRRS